MKSFLAFLIPSLFLIISCKDSNNPVGPSGGGDKITIGDVVYLTSQSVGTGGGLIKVSKPGDLLDGLEMKIPPNSYDQSKNFQISYAPIVKHQLGENFNPILPMIKITCDGSFSAHAIEIKIPIKLPANHFASGFFYNENTQTLETIPSIELTDSSITLKTQSLPSNKKLNKSTNDVQMNLIISSMIESALDNGKVLSTGFEPGYDDWEFQNSGSYAEPLGHCGGQSMSAIYYYYEKKLKENSDPLYHKFDVVHDKSTLPPKLWQDNPRGYRLASVMQREIIAGWGNVQPELLEHINKPTLVWKLFIHGMLVTGAPQLIFISRSTPPIYTHTMVVYKVNLSEKKLYIADPNFPTQVRTISFQNGILGPYNTKTKDGEPEIIFDQVGFMGVSAMVPWSALRAKYNQFEAGTIGNDIFPSYKLYIENTTGLELTDGMTVTNPTLKIVCKSEQCEAYIVLTDKLQRIEVFNKDGDPIAKADHLNQGVATINLNQGANKIGIYIPGMRSNQSAYYMDFKWITINYNQTVQPKLIITPNPLDGLKNKKYKFTATLEGATLPAKPKYVWGMDNSGATKTVYNDNTLTYKYTKTGNNTIHVSLSDSAGGTTPIYGSAQANIREAATNYEYLITSYHLSLRFTADMTFNPPDAVNMEFFISNGAMGNEQYDLIWENNSFSIIYYYGIPPTTPGGDTIFVFGGFSGTISGDGQTLLSLVATEHAIAAYGYERRDSVILGNVPMTSFPSGACNAIHEGPQVANYITYISKSGKTLQNNQWVNYNLQSINYNSTYKPKLTIQFLRIQ